MQRFLPQGRNHDRLAMDKKSKSFEERAEEYDKARARIFNQPEVCITACFAEQRPHTPILFVVCSEML